MRCIPQVHGVVNDTVQFVKGIVATEMNSALDNPVSGSVCGKEVFCQGSSKYRIVGFVGGDFHLCGQG